MKNANFRNNTVNLKNNGAGQTSMQTTERTRHWLRTLMLLPMFLLGLSLSAQAADLILDNSGTQFSTFGTWPTSTAVAGYQGINYQVHAANGPVPGALVVDNTDAGFSATGTWPVSTAVAGYLGSNYQDVFAFVVLILVLVFRPSGLLGERVGDRA